MNKMLKVFTFATILAVAFTAPTPGLIHGVPSITSSTSSVVHGAILAPTLHAAVLPAPAISSTILTAPTLHGLSLGVEGLHEAPVLSTGVLHSGLVGLPVSTVGHGVLGLGGHVLH